MKVDNLLGPYLYQYKRLALPGIGVFTLDEKAVLPDETAKIKTAIEGITFSPKTSPQLDDSLIVYIKEQTGKMKPLAEADLYSFIATAFQYLNIGKPYYFEGIGTLQKNKDNGYTFSAGTIIPQKTEEIPHRHVETKRKNPSVYVNEEPAGSSANESRLIVLLVVLVTLGLIGWGGYYLYNKNTDDSSTTTTEQPAAPAPVATAPLTTDSTGQQADTGKVVSTSPQDTAVTAAAVSQAAITAPSPTGYKFIFETTERKARAVKRYEQLKDVSVLKEYNNKVAVETKDSLSFNIYTIVPCTPADTARIKEQLNAWYYGTLPIKVKIQQ